MDGIVPEEDDASRAVPVMGWGLVVWGFLVALAASGP